MSTHREVKVTRPSRPPCAGKSAWNPGKRLRQQRVVRRLGASLQTRLRTRPLLVLGFVSLMCGSVMSVKRAHAGNRGTTSRGARSQSAAQRKAELQAGRGRSRRATRGGSRFGQGERTSLPYGEIYEAAPRKTKEETKAKHAREKAQRAAAEEEAKLAAELAAKQKEMRIANAMQKLPKFFPKFTKTSHWNGTENGFGRVVEKRQQFVRSMEKFTGTHPDNWRQLLSEARDEQARFQQEYDDFVELITTRFKADQLTNWKAIKRITEGCIMDPLNRLLSGELDLALNALYDSIPQQPTRYMRGYTGAKNTIDNTFRQILQNHLKTLNES